MFREQGWPILKYEDFIEDERAALWEACRALALSWDEAMIVWPKKEQEIAYVDEPNRTFHRSLAVGSLPAAKIVDKAKIFLGHIPQSELTWLEAAFKTFNEYHDYPVQVHSEMRLSPALSPPAFENTRRYANSQEYERLWREHDALCRSLPQSQASV